MTGRCGIEVTANAICYLTHVVIAVLTHNNYLKRFVDTSPYVGSQNSLFGALAYVKPA